MLRNLPHYVQFVKYIKQGVGNAFSRHLLLTNVTISFCLSGVGDVIQQHYRIKCREQQIWDKLRTRNMTCTGVTVGVLCHHWYQILDHRLPGRTIKVVMKKLLVDQLLFSPVCIIAFIATLRVLNCVSTYIDDVRNSKPHQIVTSKSASDHFSDFKKDMNIKGWKLYIAEWVVWPPAQVVNFYFLPTKYRVLYDNTISLMYDVYSSHVVHSDSDSEGEVIAKFTDKES